MVDIVTLLTVITLNSGSPSASEYLSLIPISSVSDSIRALTLLLTSLETSLLHQIVGKKLKPIHF